MIRLYSSLGLKSLVRGSGVLKLLPKRLGELEAMTPEIQPKFSDELILLETPAGGEKRYRVAMLTGCAQDLIFSDVNRDTRRGAVREQLRGLPRRATKAAADRCTRTTANGPWLNNRLA